MALSMIRPTSVLANLPQIASSPLTRQALQVLAPVARAIYQHRSLFGDAAISGKRLLASILGSKPQGKKKKRVLLGPPPGPYTNQIVQAPLETTYVTRNANFSRMHSSADGQSVLLVGSNLLGGACRIGTNADNRALFSATDLSETKTSLVRSNFGRALNPSLLLLGDTNSDFAQDLNRLFQFSRMFLQFRIRHLHLRYVPQLRVTDDLHGIIQIGYSSDPSLLDGLTFSATTGISNVASLFSTLQPNVSAPSWMPFDFELNFDSNQLYWCDPEGSNLGDTQDNEAVGLRSVFQGLIVGNWMDVYNATAGNGYTVGNFYIDYAIEFVNPGYFEVDTSDFISLTKEERATLRQMISDGWKPKPTDTPQPSVPPPQPSNHSTQPSGGPSDPPSTNPIPSRDRAHSVRRS